MAMGLRKNVTIGLSPEEFLRVQGAAAVAGVPVTTYLKWLLRGGVEGYRSRHLTYCKCGIATSAVFEMPPIVPPDLRGPQILLGNAA